MPPHSKRSRATKQARKQRKTVHRPYHHCRGFQNPMPCIEKPKRRHLASAQPSAKPTVVPCDVVTESLPFVPPATTTVITPSEGLQESHDRAIVFANLQSVLLSDFAANTSERRLLAAKLSQGLTRAAASEILGVSPKMIQRGEADLAENPTALIGQCQPKQKRQSMDPRDHQLALALLDTLAPVKSGHS